MPSGTRTGNVGSDAYFWTCTQLDVGAAYAMRLSYDSPFLTVSADNAKTDDFAIRCVSDIAIAEGVPQVVVMGCVTSITENSAVCSGSVILDNGATITVRGVCWSTSPHPTTDNDHTTETVGLGGFTSNLTGLAYSTTYYVRAYAKMSVAGNAGTVTATTYGNTQTFTTQPDASGCGTAIIYDIDNHAYNTVKIGTQCWMKENLRTTRYADGTPVGYYTTQGSDDYGFLYNWNNVMHEASSSSTIPSGVRGVCPIGWHVPSNAEWSDLINYVGSQANWICDGSQANVARALAANTGWNQSSTECAPGNQLTSNNLTGFSALPAGIYESGGVYEIGNVAYFWSATWRNSSSAYYWGLSRNSTSMYSGYWQPSLGYSVRCLRD